MKVVMTGRGGSGSWEIRGAQLGAAIGADVYPKLTRFTGYDLAVVVKRTPPEVIAGIRAAGIPFVYDIVDAYPQPASCSWDRPRAIAWIRETLVHLKPDAIIWPTRRMRDDCDPFRRTVSEIIPHHCRANAKPNPIREKIARIGYEGSPRYLDGWEPVIRAECARRGFEFVINPNNLADCDVVVAFRGGEWAGYSTRHWKSHVKLANCHGTGTPFVGQQESGYMENATGCEYWAESIKDFRTALDWLEEHQARQHIAEEFRKHAYTIEHAAADLKGFLDVVIANRL